MANTYMGAKSPKGNVGVRGVVDTGELSAYSQGSLSGFTGKTVSGWIINVGGNSSIQDVAVAKNASEESELLVGTNSQAISFTIGGAPGTSGYSRTDALVIYKDPFVTSTVNDAIDAVDYQVVDGIAATTGTQTPPTMSTIRAACPTGAFVAVIGYVTVAYGASGVALGNYSIARSININNIVDDTIALSRVIPVEGMQLYQKDIDSIRIYDGSEWLYNDLVWQTYNPDVYTNNTLWSKGNGSASGRYKRHGKEVIVEVVITLGSSTNWGAAGLQEITLPFAVESNSILTKVPRGTVAWIDAGIVLAWGYVNTNSTTRVVLSHAQYGNTNTNFNGGSTNTAPFAMAVGDSITFQATFPIA